MVLESAPGSYDVALSFSGEDRPYVAQVLLRKVDAPAVLRQRICPVSGDVLGSRGRVVKVLIGEYPLYLCGEDCLAAVQQEPQKFLPPPPEAPRTGAALPTNR